MCGKSEERLFKTLIEEVEMGVCSSCSKFGKVMHAIGSPIKNIPKKTFAQEPQEEKISLIVDGYADIIKKKREGRGLSQKDFALKLNEKESTIHKIETGHIEPSISLAQKIQRFLGVKLIEEVEEKHEKIKRKEDVGFTLGDFIKIKNRQ